MKMRSGIILRVLPHTPNMKTAAMVNQVPRSNSTSCPRPVRRLPQSFQSNRLNKITKSHLDNIQITIEDVSTMKKHDLTLFINVWKKSFKDNSFPISINNMNKTHILVVRHENGKVVGGSILSRWIHDLCVDPEQQGKGIGRMILKYLQKQGNIILQMDKESEHLRSFYTKNGMIKTQESYDSYEYINQ